MCVEPKQEKWTELFTRLLSIPWAVKLHSVFSYTPEEIEKNLSTIDEMLWWRVTFEMV